MLKLLLFIILFAAALVAVLFGAAGRLDLPFAWATLGIYISFVVIIMSQMDPELRRERFKPGPGGEDRRMRFVLMPFVFAYWVVAGLDIGRYHWSKIPLALQIVGLAGFTLSMTWVLFTIRANRFFSPVVRIQAERGHHVIREGPYAVMRHPGYVGATGAAIFGPLALGSWFAMLPASVFVIAFVRRTLIEDRFLKRELPGYTEYAQQVQYRWIPGIW